jgi:hypothetical protein
VLRFLDSMKIELAAATAVAEELQESRGAKQAAEKLEVSSEIC